MWVCVGRVLRISAGLRHSCRHSWLQRPSTDRALLVVLGPFRLSAPSSCGSHHSRSAYRQETTAAAATTATTTATTITTTITAVARPGTIDSRHPPPTTLFVWVKLVVRRPRFPGRQQRHLPERERIRAVEAFRLQYLSTRHRERERESGRRRARTTTGPEPQPSSPIEGKERELSSAGRPIAASAEEGTLREESRDRQRVARQSGNRWVGQNNRTTERSSGRSGRAVERQTPLDTSSFRPSSASNISTSLFSLQFRKTRCPLALWLPASP